MNDVPGDHLHAVLDAWSTLLGDAPVIGDEATGRELWPVTATDGRAYFLKRLGPWRNLPVADQARVVGWLAHHRLGVAEFMITEAGSVYAGGADDAYLLLPRLPTDPLTPAETVAAEPAVGRAIAMLHRALADYPWPTHSYTERLADTITGPLRLPPDVADGFLPWKEELAAGLARLPLQLVHGDLTPANVLLRRGEAPGFIDFDHLPQAPRIWDVARYLSRRLRTRWQGGAEEIHRAACVTPLLRGYHESSPITEAELMVLPGLILAANIIEVSYASQISAGELERRRLPDHDEELADTIAAARWQLAEPRTIDDAIRMAI